MAKSNFDFNWLIPSLLRPQTEKLQTLQGPTGADKWYDAFLSYLGFGWTSYDPQRPTYVSKGYQANGDVYSIINQIATKGSSVPFCVKKVKDRNKQFQFQYQRKSLLSGGLPELMKFHQLKAAAYEEEIELKLPIDRPNPLQTWSEFIALYLTFLSLDGNAYIYKARPDMGPNKGKPMHLYLLPSHLIQIVVKKTYAAVGFDTSPIDHYMLINGDRYHDFKESDVIHVNYPNPNYDLNGSQLYGQSPLRAVLKEMQASNEGNDNNIRMQRSGGAIGLIFGKNGAALEEDQAAALKKRLVEMRADISQLAQIAPISTEVGFIPITLDNQKLMPFEAQKYAQKKIANALNWSDKLLNNDDGAKYDNLKIAYKDAILNKLVPDLNMLEEAFNSKWLPEFKGDYIGSRFYFQYEELPEMSENMEELSKWIMPLLLQGVVNKEEVRRIFNFEPTEDPDMLIHTVPMGQIPLSEAVGPVNLDGAFADEGAG